MSERPTYGNWRLPSRPGIGTLGAAGSALLLGGLVVTLVVALVSWGAALAAAGAFSVAIVPLAVRASDGRSGLAIAAGRAAWTLRRLSGRTSAAPRVLPGGGCPLPRVLSGTEMLGGRDAYGRPFGVIHDAGAGTFTVALECDPDGGALVDPEQVDTWVAGWGAWLAEMAHEPGLLGAAVTVATAPDPGTRLAAGVLSQLDPAAPQAARDLIGELAAAYPLVSSQVSTWVTLTFRPAPGTRAAGRGARAAAMIADLAVRVPPLAAALAAGGAGPAVPMSAAQIAAEVRAAYHPSERPAAPGREAEPAAARGLWHGCGPAGADEAIDSYRHGDGVSRTWVACEAPRGTVRSGVLRGLLEPSPHVRRKRVTLLYRPLGQAAAARAVEADRRTAHFMAASATGLVNARASAAVRAAEQAAAEEAAGAGLTEFALLVTATAGTAEELRAAEADIANLAASARLRLRIARGQQASAFAVTLPAGVLPWLRARTPGRLRGAL